MFRLAENHTSQQDSCLLSSNFIGHMAQVVGCQHKLTQADQNIHKLTNNLINGVCAQLFAHEFQQQNQVRIESRNMSWLAPTFGNLSSQHFVDFVKRSSRQISVNSVNCIVFRLKILY